jgi:hypothetical protein
MQDMQAASNLSIMTWLQRVEHQFEADQPSAVSKYDSNQIKLSIEQTRFIGTLFNLAKEAASSGNQQKVVVNIKNVNGSDKDKDKGKDEKKVDYRLIAGIGTVSTLVVSGAVFLATRLSKKQERAQNYLDKTKAVLVFTNNPSRYNNYSKDENLKEIAEAQEKIDKKALDKITSYKQAALALGTGAAAIGVSAIAMPWFATAGIVTGITGCIFVALSAFYATLNLARHWDDQSEARKLYQSISENLTEAKNHFTDLPPNYEESQTAYGYGYLANESLPPAYQYKGPLPSAPPVSEVIQGSCVMPMLHA